MKERIEKWIIERNISFDTINEPNHIFHFILKDVGPAKITSEVFQEKNSSEFIAGFMTFLSPELTFKIYKFSEIEKADFKRKVDEFLASIKIDYRTGMRHFSQRSISLFFLSIHSLCHLIPENASCILHKLVLFHFLVPKIL